MLYLPFALKWVFSLRLSRSPHRQFLRVIVIPAGSFLLCSLETAARLDIRIKNWEIFYTRLCGLITCNLRDFSFLAACACISNLCLFHQNKNKTLTFSALNWYAYVYAVQRFWYWLWITECGYINIQKWHVKFIQLSGRAWNFEQLYFLLANFQMTHTRQ